MQNIYFLHGFMGTAQSHFSHQIEHYQNKYEINTIDLPGHGKSSMEASENYFEQAIQYVIKRIKEQGPGVKVRH
ncbi:hypothetical protein LC087_15940 [Bacillus carboniphilus]|uniref:AB hydrolase-1 domain-containing protein n=1 Tax=Bacillus carboniphilus TaxID=86663 RepID=A0ABY9JVA5_9BACI|nr:hypothetical protein [Bacillus carboniphilus]WLR42213.1 hypothetical protein LC087_15940 [Bacillus carboniphilus]